MPQLRIALSLPGEASLGAFQAGAVCALLVGLGRVNEADGQAARIDVITGASSGSLTAVLAARALLAGQDPVASLRRAWVTEPSLDALRGRDGHAPLSLERAREVAQEELARDGGSPPRAQRTGVTVELALAALRGFNYEVPRRQGGRGARRRDPLPATSYLDWWRHRFEPGGFTPEWSAAVDAAVASASHPAAFAPVALDRSSLRKAYLRHGVENLPPDLELWYTDGGLVDREPLGRCLGLARAADEGEHDGISRVLLLVEPDVDVAPGIDSTAWAGGEAAPSWTATLSRALRVIVSHSLYEDLRRVEKTNNRIAWTERLAAALAPLLADEEHARAVLGAALKEMKNERRPWHHGDGDGDGAASSGRGDEADPSLEALLAQALGTAAGLASKVPVDVEVVTAQRSDLAGESLFQFGGFLAERLRAQDFLVGYANMLAWMEGPGGLAAAGLPAPLALAAGEEVRARARDIPGWVGGAGGRRRVPLAAQVRLAQIGLRAARLGLRAARSGGVRG